MVRQPIVRQPISGPAAWRGEQLREPAEWTIQLSAEQIEDIEQALAGCEARRLSLFDVGREDFPLPVAGPALEALSSGLEDGHGFALLRGLPVARWGEARSRLALWGLGTHLGWAEVQDAAGNLMHDVRDVGRRFGSDDTIRYFQTRESIDFHNDGADIFALMCLKAGLQGGRSRLASAVEVFNEIVRRRPDLAEVLQQPFHFDARGQHSGGARTQHIPVYAFEQGAPSIIMKSMYIRAAQRFEDVPPLSQAQVEALALLDSIPEEPGMALEFDLSPGDVLFGNNHTVLHARTAFTNRDEPGEQRHLLRLWLTVPNGRPLPPHYADTREFGPSYARRVRAR
ncbi:MAG: TauD/TfdA family dioxygenase [Gammaproteobacteria bacterium]|nr:TauD/TfdA family dioxygenase [Gammaproteobacteria bacterium]